MRHPFFFSLAVVLASPALAQTTERTWSSASYDAFEPSDLGLSLIYGLPESDDVVLRANCMSPGGGTGPTIISAAFSAPAGAAVNGQPVFVEFEGLTGGLPVVSGNAVGIGAEIGITGASIDVPSDDRLWAHLATTQTVRYRIRGQETWVELPGDPAQVTAFVSDCVSRGDAPATAATIATPALNCATRDTLRSSDQMAPRDITVTNDSAALLRVIWLDTNGVDQELGVLQPGEFATLGTDAGHIWIIADADGLCLSIHDAAQGDITVGTPAPPVDTK